MKVALQDERYIFVQEFYDYLGKPQTMHHVSFPEGGHKAQDPRSPERESATTDKPWFSLSILRQDISARGPKMSGAQGYQDSVVGMSSLSNHDHSPLSFNSPPIHTCRCESIHTAATDDWPLALAPSLEKHGVIGQVAVQEQTPACLGGFLVVPGYDDKQRIVVVVAVNGDAFSRNFGAFTKHFFIHDYIGWVVCPGRVYLRGSAPTFVWKESGKPFRKNLPQCTEPGLNPDPPIFGSLFQHENSSLTCGKSGAISRGCSPGSAVSGSCGAASNGRADVVVGFWVVDVVRCAFCGSTGGGGGSILHHLHGGNSGKLFSDQTTMRHRLIPCTACDEEGVISKDWILMPFPRDGEAVFLLAVKRVRAIDINCQSRGLHPWRVRVILLRFASYQLTLPPHGDHRASRASGQLPDSSSPYLSYESTLA
uniref:(California timema) hypothetical protein n=1 Tax=Timema californicum TaxID=61474 RepID=A0A7R9JBN0_TIMCA|nr:unnamed protein product [Timema californicum]